MGQVVADSMGARAVHGHRRPGRLRARRGAQQGRQVDHRPAGHRQARRGVAHRRPDLRRRADHHHARRRRLRRSPSSASRTSRASGLRERAFALLDIADPAVPRPDHRRAQGPQGRGLAAPSPPRAQRGLTSVRPVAPTDPHGLAAGPARRVAPAHIPKERRHGHEDPGASSAEDAHHRRRFGLRRSAPRSQKLRASKALIMTDPGVADSGMVETVERPLHDAGIEVGVYEHVVPEPPHEQPRRDRPVLVEQGGYDLHHRLRRRLGHRRGQDRRGAGRQRTTRSYDHGGRRPGARARACPSSPSPPRPAPAPSHGHRHLRQREAERQAGHRVALPHAQHRPRRPHAHAELPAARHRRLGHGRASSTASRPTSR